MKLLYREESKYDMHPLKAAFWIIVALSLMTAFTIDINMAYVEGVPITIEGKIQFVKQRHDVFWNYDYTTIEIQTFSEDTYQYTFLEHIHLEFGEVYRIKYTRTSLRGHHVHMYNVVLEIEKIS